MKAAYCSAFTDFDFDKKCTPKVSNPPAMAAIISQPLWRKNAACGLWSIVGAVSGLVELMKIYGSEVKNLTSMSFACSSCASEIHSSTVCACAMSPGPNTTLGIPLAARMAASQK